MQTTLIRRFTTSDQLAHFLNAIAWIALGLSGISIGSALRTGADPSHAALGTHFLAGAVLTVVLLVYVVGAQGRFVRMLHEIFRRDRHFFAWLRCFGGYPQKFLGLALRPGTVPPQGRYNAGQRIAYAVLILANFALVASGAALFFLHDPRGDASPVYEALRWVHSSAFAASLLILFAHIPMGLASTVSLRALLRFGKGFIPEVHAKETASLWVAEDLEVESDHGDRRVLRERDLKARK